MKRSSKPRWPRVDDGDWFAAKRFGFGATPVTWHGWAPTIGFSAMLLAALPRIQRRAPRLATRCRSPRRSPSSSG